MLIFWANCKEPKKPDNGMQEVRLDAKLDNAAIIRDPRTADNPIDTFNVAKLSLNETLFDFGEVEQGMIVTHVFKFTNNGKAPLLITDVKTTCGCTVPDYKKESIAPGQSDAITVHFDTKTKENNQSKPITIYANTFPSATTLLLKGTVKKPQ